MPLGLVSYSIFVGLFCAVYNYTSGGISLFAAFGVYSGAGSISFLVGALWLSLDSANDDLPSVHARD